MLKHLVPLLLVGSNAFGSSISCKVATNPESMTATVVPEKGAKSTEKVTSAALQVGDEHGQDSVRLSVVTASGRKGEAYAFNNQSGGYSVECDGGQLNFLAVPHGGGETVLSTKGVRLDQLGCDGEIYIETKSTTFVPGACPPPATN